MQMPCSSHSQVGMAFKFKCFKSHYSLFPLYNLQSDAHFGIMYFTLLALMMICGALQVHSKIKSSIFKLHTLWNAFSIEACTVLYSIRALLKTTDSCNALNSFLQQKIRFVISTNCNCILWFLPYIPHICIPAAVVAAFQNEFSI